VLGFDCSSDYNLIPIASTVQAMLPHVKVLMHLRRQADRLMSELGISSSKNFDDRITQDHSLLEYKDHLCPVQAVEDFQHGLSARQVLYIDSQMLFFHRDAVMQEVFAFTGVPMAPLPPEVVTNCKEDRYSDWQEGSGCFNGTSRVSTWALSQIQPAYEECNVKLAELLKIRRESLYPQDPMPNGLPPPASTAPKALEDGSTVDPTSSVTDGEQVDTVTVEAMARWAENTFVQMHNDSSELSAVGGECRGDARFRARVRGAECGGIIRTADVAYSRCGALRGDKGREGGGDARAVEFRSVPFRRIPCP
jgi:hypothetical protein